MRAKILLVDDEPAILSGYQRTLYRDFEVETAEGGELGLEAIRTKGPFAVVISDMRMPGMSGAQFLARARQTNADTVRMLLTGYTDLGAAMEAINHGNIFRFLTKPCTKEELTAAIDSGVEQYELIRMEKELLEKTLLGSIRVLAEVLAASSPEAFSRSRWIAWVARHVAKKFSFAFLWRLEAAATLSQLGCVTLDTELVQKAFDGTALSQEEQARFDTHPQAAVRLLAGIPRLEPSAWMIGQQLVKQIPPLVPDLPDALVQETVLGANILKLAVAFDHLRTKLSSEKAVIAQLATRKDFDPALLDALAGLKAVTGGMEARTVPILKMSTGMVLDQDLRNKHGMLLVAKGQETTRALLIKLENFARAGMIDREVNVLVPV